MQKAELYQIEFAGLKPGSYSFDYTVGKSFFEQAEDAEIMDGKVSITITMAREERMLDLHFSIRGAVVVPCDRCTEPLEMQIEGNERLIVKYGDRYHEESEDVQIIPETAHQFDVKPFIYEYIHLLLPIRRVHPDDARGKSQCDPEVMKRLQELSEHHATDPRWAALDQLKKNRKS